MQWRGVAVSALALSLGGATGGCADFQYNLAVNSTAEVLKRGSTSIEQEPDVDLARDALPGTLKTIDSFLAAAPAQPILLELTATAYVQYAFGFLEDEVERLGAEAPGRAHLVERTTSLYDRGAEIGVRLVEVEHPGFRAALKAGDVRSLETLLAALGPKTGPGLYWAGLAMGSAINLHRDDINRVADLPKVVAILERAHALVPEYFHHGAALALGVVYASQGKAVGGDPDRARAMFDEVITATAGKYLMARVLRARFLDTVTLDRKDFERTLQEVAEAPRDLWPEQRLANELARRRAVRYLAQAEDLF